MSITVSDIVSEFGAYYLGNENNQNAARILQLPFQKSETAELFPVQTTTNQAMERRAEVTIDRVLQPFQKDFTPISTTAFTPRAIEMFRMKIDLQETPDDLVKSWVGFLANLNETDRTQWPFIRWWIEKLIMPAHTRDLEKNEIYGGVYAAPTPGTAGASGTALNGIKKIINAFYSGGDLTPISMGATPDPDTDDARDFTTYVEEMVAKIPELYWDEKIEFTMSKKLHKFYRKGRELKYNVNYNNVADLDVIKEFDNFSVKGVASMAGSTKIWGTMDWNKVRLVNGIGNINNFQVEKVDRKVKVYTDYFMGVGFWVPEVLFTNDVELS